MTDLAQTSINKQRDSYIDVVKGLALLSIMLIHTVFLSGEEYVPKFCQNIVLCFDVPVFFLLSGMGVACNNGKISFPSMFLKFSLAFGILAFFADLLSLNRSFSTFMNYFLLSNQRPPIPLLLNAHFAYWFVSVFIISMAIVSVIITYFRHLGIFIIIFLLIYYPIRLLNQVPILDKFWILDGFHAGSLYASIFFCYVAFSLIGYYSYPYLDIFKKRFGIAMLICIVGLLYFVLSLIVHGWSMPNLQMDKFPPKCSYIGVSMVSISLVLLFYNRNVQCSFLSHIGKNAIWYYAGQCVGGSMLYNIAPHVACVWEVKLLLMYLCNIIISVLAAEGIRLCYKFLIWIKIIRLPERPSNKAEMVKSS